MNLKKLYKQFYLHHFQRYEFMLPNVYLHHVGNEMDILGIRKSGFIDEIEIKQTYADYQADFEKTVWSDRGVNPHWTGRRVDTLKHDTLKEGTAPCNYFSFLMPDELAGKCAIPAYAGLYLYRVFTGGVIRIREAKRAPRLHRRKISIEQKYGLGRKAAYRYWDILD